MFCFVTNFFSDKYFSDFKFVIIFSLICSQNFLAENVKNKYCLMLFDNFITNLVVFSLYIVKYIILKKNQEEEEEENIDILI